jgi:hypothetical protein
MTVHGDSFQRCWPIQRRCSWSDGRSSKSIRRRVQPYGSGQWSCRQTGTSFTKLQRSSQPSMQEEGGPVADQPAVSRVVNSTHNSELTAVMLRTTIILSHEFNNHALRFDKHMPPRPSNGASRNGSGELHSQFRMNGLSSKVSLGSNNRMVLTGNSVMPAKNNCSCEYVQSSYASLLMLYCETLLVPIYRSNNCHASSFSCAICKLNCFVLLLLMIINVMLRADVQVFLNI